MYWPWFPAFFDHIYISGFSLIRVIYWGTAKKSKMKAIVVAVLVIALAGLSKQVGRITTITG